jgi:hypothetical protein
MNVNMLSLGNGDDSETKNYLHVLALHDIPNNAFKYFTTALNHSVYTAYELHRVLSLYTTHCYIYDENARCTVGHRTLFRFTHECK